MLDLDAVNRNANCRRGQTEAPNANCRRGAPKAYRCLACRKFAIDTFPIANPRLKTMLMYTFPQICTQDLSNCETATPQRMPMHTLPTNLQSNPILSQIPQKNMPMSSLSQICTQDLSNCKSTPPNAFQCILFRKFALKPNPIANPPQPHPIANSP